jgi:uncharacterized protein with ParB-like and HNH nuclease domain
MAKATAKRTKLTNNSDETDISALLSGDVVFSIPFFQRSYKWKPERLKQLNSDILTIVDEASEFHFLGAVIIHGLGSNPSDPKPYEVIDGQQRITTLFLYIAAAVRTLAENDEVAEATGLFLKYMVIPRDTNLHSNVKLHPCKEDRAQLNYVLDDILKLKAFKDKLGSTKIKRLPSSGRDTGTLRNNYKSALRFFRSEFEQGGLERVRAVYRAILESMSVVQIDVWDPTNGPKIFDALNSRQEPMTIGDLVRNEIFAKVADDHPDEIEQIDQHHWQPFYKKFQVGSQNLFDSYFFPYGLTRNPNLRKSEVYNTLREQWRDIDDPKLIIAQLEEYQDAFIDIVTGENKQGHSKTLAELFRNLYLSNAPTSTYPFLMQLSRAVQDGSLNEKDAIESLRVIESFLVRRAVCGQEPTGLHAVFKRLWSDCEGAPSRERIEKEIRKHKTVAWPTQEEFHEAARSRPLYGARITSYVLRELNRAAGGDQPDNIPWIEHVLPETPAKEWFEDFSKEQHQAMKDLLANLIPLSKEMNASLGNKAYEIKREVYKADSMFKSAREFSHEYSKWNPSALESRASKLADWCVKRWLY